MNEDSGRLLLSILKAYYGRSSSNIQVCLNKRRVVVDGFMVFYNKLSAKNHTKA